MHVGLEVSTQYPMEQNVYENRLAIVKHLFPISRWLQSRSHTSSVKVKVQHEG